MKKDSWPARAYNGTTTHYNFYFNARERMKTSATTLYDGQLDQYDRILAYANGKPVDVINPEALNHKHFAGRWK